MLDILEGRHELLIPPKQITDPIGTDRRGDWQEQEAYQTLSRSIETNGQDTPVLVWPEDPHWRPDPLNPTDVVGTHFLLLTGRRRHAVATALGRPLRAVLAPIRDRQSRSSRFDMLFLRFRENEERENLGAFERLLSIGEMFEAHCDEAGPNKLTASAFADRIGVHESIVSRARAVFKVRDEILNAFKNAYDMSFREIQAALAKLSAPKVAAPRSKTPALRVARKIGTRNLHLQLDKGRLRISAAGMKASQAQLEKLGDLLTAYLTELQQGDTSNAIQSDARRRPEPD